MMPVERQSGGDRIGAAGGSSAAPTGVASFVFSWNGRAGPFGGSSASDVPRAPPRARRTGAAGGLHGRADRRHFARRLMERQGWALRRIEARATCPVERRRGRAPAGEATAAAGVASSAGSLKGSAGPFGGSSASEVLANAAGRRRAGAGAVAGGVGGGETTARGSASSGATAPSEGRGSRDIASWTRTTAARASEDSEAGSSAWATTRMPSRTWTTTAPAGSASRRRCRAKGRCLAGAHLLRTPRVMGPMTALSAGTASRQRSRRAFRAGAPVVEGTVDEGRGDGDAGRGVGVARHGGRSPGRPPIRRAPPRCRRAR